MPRLSVDEAKQLGLDVGAPGIPGAPGRKGRSKYGARPTDSADGVRYASAAEAARAAELWMMREGGAVIDFVRQPRFLLPDRSSVYVADFLVVWAANRGPDGSPVTVEDVKGARTPKFEADVRRWRAHARLPLVILTANGRRGWKTETITPDRSPR